MAQQPEKARLTDLSQDPARFSTQRIQKRASLHSTELLFFFSFTVFSFNFLFFNYFFFGPPALRHWLILVVEILSFSHYYFSVACQK